MISANFSDEVVSNLPPETKTGIYFGWAKVDQGPVYKMVMSVGWNPYFKNEKKSMVIKLVQYHLVYKKLKMTLFLFRKHISFTNSMTTFMVLGCVSLSVITLGPKKISSH